MSDEYTHAKVCFLFRFSVCFLVGGGFTLSEASTLLIRKLYLFSVSAPHRASEGTDQDELINRVRLTSCCRLLLSPPKISSSRENRHRLYYTDNLSR